jgi:DNA-binding MarR family transcriptional regulator
MHGVPQPLSDVEMAAWHGFMHAHAVVRRVLEAELEAEHRLTLAAYEVLAHLSEAPDRRLRMSDLAATSLVSPSGLTRLVDKLCRDGHVRRERCASDSRVLYATLTDSGFALLERAWPAHLRGVREHVIDRLDRRDIAALARALPKLVPPGGISPSA